MGNHKTKLAFGTAQLGMDYGIANRYGKPCLNRANSILKKALELGIHTFDSAPVYGDSEYIIGSFRRQTRTDREFTVISKLPKLKDSIDKEVFVYSSINNTLDNLAVDIIDYYLTHDSTDLEDKEIIGALFMARDEGLIGVPGASLYTVGEAMTAIECGLKVLQVPVNIFDRRFITPDFLTVCRKNKVTLMARSIFLQGLFFINTTNLPDFLKEAATYLDKLQLLSTELGMTVRDLAIRFVCSVEDFDYIIIGADSEKQLEENVMAFEEPALTTPEIRLIEETFVNLPQKIIDPRRWQRG